MSEDTHIWQQISDYLNGSMSPEDSIAFKEKLGSHPDLAAYIETDRLAFEVVIGHEAMKLKEQMKKDLAKPVKSSKYWWSLPLLAILAGGIYWLSIEKEVKTASIRQVEITNPVLKLDEAFLPQATPQKIEGPIVKKVNRIRNQPSEINASKTVEAVKDSTSYITVKPASEKADILVEKLLPSSVQLIDPCHGVHLKATFVLHPACKNSSTGEISVNLKSIKEGTAPYSYSIDNNKFRTDPAKALKAGSYPLFIKDGNNCITKLNDFMIQEISCQQTNEFTYNPGQDEAWAIPYDEARKPKLFKIIDKGGLEIYNVSVTDGNPSHWNGESNTGLSVGIGYHLFFVEYMDGTVDKGAITILR